VTCRRRHGHPTGAPPPERRVTGLTQEACTLNRRVRSVARPIVDLDESVSDQRENNGDGRVSRGELGMSRNARWLTKFFVVAAFVSVLGFHETWCFVSFSPGGLCQRSDGSLWRGTSGTCAGYEDPDCSESVCEPSVLLSEDSRQSCHWIVTRSRVPASGVPPYFSGEAPGSGLPGD